MLKTSSVESYLSSVATILKLKNLKSDIFNNFVSNSILKGGKILELKTLAFKPTRKVMTLARHPKNSRTGETIRAGCSQQYSRQRSNCSKANELRLVTNCYDHSWAQLT